MRGFNGRKLASVSLLSGSSVCTKSVLIDIHKETTYKTLVSHSWPSTVKPRLLVNMARSNEGSCRHLLSVEAEADIARAVLALWDGARDSFRDKTVR